MTTQDCPICPNNCPKKAEKRVGAQQRKAANVPAFRVLVFITSTFAFFRLRQYPVSPDIADWLPPDGEQVTAVKSQWRQTHKTRKKNKGERKDVESLSPQSI